MQETTKYIVNGLLIVMAGLYLWYEFGHTQKPGAGHNRPLQTASQVTKPQIKENQFFSHLDRNPFSIKGSISTKQEKDLVEAVRRIADAGEPRGQYYLAMLHYSGIGMPNSQENYHRYIKRAAYAGHPHSQYLHAMHLMNQDTLRRRKKELKKYAPGMAPAREDPYTVEVVSWLRKSVEGGDTRAGSMLAQHYKQTKEWDKAAALYQRGVTEADTCSAYQLAELYLKGRGVRKDTGKAIQLLKRDTGCLNAADLLADVYEKGLGVPVDYKKAAQALVPNGKYPVYQTRIGNLYEKGGPGLRRDLDKALLWYEKAAAMNNYGDAVKGRDRVKRLKKYGH